MKHEAAVKRDARMWCGGTHVLGRAREDQHETDIGAKNNQEIIRNQKSPPHLHFARLLFLARNVLGQILDGRLERAQIFLLLPGRQRVVLAIQAIDIDLLLLDLVHALVDLGLVLDDQTLLLRQLLDALVVWKKGEKGGDETKRRREQRDTCQNGGGEREAIKIPTLDESENTIQYRKGLNAKESNANL